MNVLNKKGPFLLFIGDIFILFISLWLTLVLRFGHIPSYVLYIGHVIPFSFLFVIWIIVYLIAGLYEKRVLVLRHKLPNTIFRTQIVNSIIAVFFFYFIPYFGITPKTNLFIYLGISFFLVLLWRLVLYQLFGTRRQNAYLIASGSEMRELRDEVNSNPNYNLHFISSINLDVIPALDFNEEILKNIYAEEVSIIAVDFDNEKIEPILPHLYNLIFSKIVFIDMYKVYEDIFNRIPLSLIKYSWFLENISLAPKIAYDILKRLMDILIASFLGLFSLIVYPFVYIAIKLDDGGDLFSFQERVGQNNKSIRIFKFRTMSVANDQGKWGDKNNNKVTKIGSFLRKTRIDELPQLWNVIHGDISLIGPRPEFFEAVKEYEKQIPYYGIRHLIKPGLSGWAQIYHDNHPHHGVSIEATKEKLSYDLFYLKNRSFILDIIIALKTIKKLLSRSGI